MELDNYYTYLSWHWEGVLTLKHPNRHSKRCNYCLSMEKRLLKLCQSLGSTSIAGAAEH